VDTDDLVRPAGGHPEFHDRDGGRVGGEDRARTRDDLVEGGEHLGLDLLVLRHRLDHKVAVGHVREVGGETDAAQGGVAVGFGQLVAAQATVEGGDDSSAPCLHGLGIRLPDDDVESGTRADLGDAAAHEAGSDDAHAANALSRAGRGGQWAGRR